MTHGRALAIALLGVATLVLLYTPWAHKSFPSGVRWAVLGAAIFAIFYVAWRIDRNRHAATTTRTRELATALGATQTADDKVHGCLGGREIESWLWPANSNPRSSAMHRWLTCELRGALPQGLKVKRPIWFDRLVCLGRTGSWLVLRSRGGESCIWARSDDMRELDNYLTEQRRQVLLGLAALAPADEIGIRRFYVDSDGLRIVLPIFPDETSAHTVASYVRRVANEVRILDGDSTET